MHASFQETIYFRRNKQLKTYLLGKCDINLHAYWLNNEANPRETIFRTMDTFFVADF